MTEWNNEYFATNLRYKLNEFDLTQKELANSIGVSTATLSDWINGKKLPRMDKLSKIATLFHIEIGDLLKNPNESETDHYYLTEETREMAQSIFENNELRALFSAAKDSTPDDLKLAHDMLVRLKRKEDGSDL